MSSRFFAIGALAASVAVTASSAVAPARLINLHGPAVQGSARLYAVGTRSAAQRQSGTTAKMDSVLADLSRHASLARPQQLLADLHSLSPAARFAQLSAGGPAYVAIDATTRGDPQALEAALTALGLQKAAVYSNDVGGLLPVSQLEAAAARAEVAGIRAAMSRASAGAVASQGDYAQRSIGRAHQLSDASRHRCDGGRALGQLQLLCRVRRARSGVPVSGNEGYASNGFTADYATDVSTGALPANVDVLAGSGLPRLRRTHAAAVLGRRPRDAADRARRRAGREPRRSTPRRTARRISPAASATGRGRREGHRRRRRLFRRALLPGRHGRAGDRCRRSARRGVFLRGRQRRRPVLPEHRAELRHDLDQRIERGRASAQLRPDGRDEYDLAAGNTFRRFRRAISSPWWWNGISRT